MRTARLARQAWEALFALVDDDISSVAREEETAVERAALDALIEEMEQEWVAAQRVETWRVSRDLTDQRRARRAHRRADREALRLLPVQVGRPDDEAA